MSSAGARHRGPFPALSLLLPGLLLGGLLAACDTAGDGAIETQPAEHRSAVRVAAVERVEGGRTLQLPGVLRATQRAQPAFLQPGYLAERLVARGDRVSAGQALATLANPALGPALNAARAQVRELDERLVQLDAEYQRMLELNTRGLASADQLDRALAARNSTRAAREQALARVDEAREQLGDATLRAPFDAVVSDLLVEPGDFVQAGQPVLALAGSGALEVEVKLPEGLSLELATGMPARVRALGTGAVADATLRELGVARDGRLAPAVLELTPAPAGASAWIPGLSVQVSLSLAAEPALSVPLSAVVDPGTGRTRVYRVHDGRAILTPVQVGRPLGARVEVRGELAAGDQVVVAGHQQLLDGDLLRILP
jgi:multidrug efflux system membrane fusion protein